MSDTSGGTIDWMLAIIPMVFAIGVMGLAVLALRRGLKYPARFRNPANGYVETVSIPFLWSFLFGVFYFASKGLWLAAILCVLCPPCWLIFPFLAKRMLTRQYLRMGWEQIS